MLHLVAYALLAAAGPAAAPAPSPTPAPATKPKKICRVEEAITGSITPKRICVTVPQQTAAPSKPAQDAARDKQPQGSSTSGTNN
jgi:hypothetical protein